MKIESNTTLLAPQANEQNALALGRYMDLAMDAYAPNTLRAIQSDLRVWSAWCAANKVQLFPATTEAIVWFVQAQGETGKAVSTIRRYVASLAKIHDAAEIDPNPAAHKHVTLALKALARQQAQESSKTPGRGQAQAIRYEQLREILAGIEEAAEQARDETARLIALRDAALLSLMYDSGRRRSEAARVRAEHIEDGQDNDGSGLLYLPWSKTDQEGEGTYSYLRPDTMRRIQQWMEASGIRSGPLFRAVGVKESAFQTDENARPLSSHSINQIVKKWAARAGIFGVSGHSLRIGFAQDLVAAGESTIAVMQAGGWKTERMPAHYARKLEAASGAMARLAKKQARETGKDASPHPD